jgi:Protein of unknown function (DUF2865)
LQTERSGRAPRSEGVVLIGKRHRDHLKTALVIAAVSAAMSATVPGLAHAQGFFDFLFGGPQRPEPQPPSYNYPPPPPEGVGRIAPAPLPQEHITGGEGSTGHGVAFCVRLCDGQHFPMEKMANATPADTCRAICPHAATKVFFGSEIGGAVAQDGQQYTALPTAFVYRKQLVANCTCNGTDSLGLASFDVKTDPTLRPGDIVSTGDGLLSYTGKSGQGAAFAPLNPATLPVDIGGSQTPSSASTPAPAAAQSGTTAQQDNMQQGNAPPNNAQQIRPQGPSAPPAAKPHPQSRPPQ